MAGQVHATIRRIDVSLGGELSRRPRQQPGGHRIVTRALGQTIYCRCLTQPEGLKNSPYVMSQQPNQQHATHTTNPE